MIIEVAVVVGAFIAGWFSSNYIMIERRYDWWYRRARRRKQRHERWRK